MPADWETAGFGLYLHWPFCQAKCPYCDFNSHVSASIDQTRWQTAYLSEINRIALETQGRTLSTIFFGGGTPSLMEPSLVAALIESIRAAWPMPNDPEITLEANPTSVEADRFRAYREAGVTRVSLGVQALNDRDLQRLGRLHSAKEAQQAFDIARQTFDRVSFDLIYARQHQSLADWRAELTEALAMAAGGERGVLAALEILEHEIKTTMALAGINSLDQLNPDLVERAQQLAPTHVLGAFPFLEEGY